jgi:hypothetical protein
MCRGHSLCLCCVCVHTYVWMSIATNIMYKGICTCQNCQSGHYAADYANLIYLRQFRRLNNRMADRHKVWTFCISYVGLRFCLCFGHLHYREFVRLLPTSYIFLLCNHRRTKSGVFNVKRWSVCALVGHQWCGGLYFAGATILTDGCPPLPPRLGRHKSFWTSLMLYKGLVWTWRLIGHFSKVSKFWCKFEGPWWR